MRIALLSYRSKAHVGGQGVYVRQLSHGLVELGHDVEVISGQPYPEDLDPRVRLTRLASLDLYRDDDPFRTPRPGEFRDAIDVLEFLTMKTGCFAEPLTFSLRAARLLRERGDEFDVVHDNQTLGYGMLLMLRRGVPLVTTIHHPISRDFRVDLAAARGLRKRLGVRQWYRFVAMQARVARRLPVVIGVSSVSADDTATDFGIERDRITVVPLGVDTDLFAPRETPRVPGRIVAMASADRPLKGIRHLLDAVAKLRVDHDIELCLVSNLEAGGRTERQIEALGIGDIVRVMPGISDEQLADLMASAEVMCVPSLYEGFSLPTVEALASGTPIVASRAGALPEVVGDCAVLTPPGDVEALVAGIGRLLDDPAERERLGSAGRARAEERYSWTSVARATAETYRAAIDAATT
ncbi:glycosyltransferase, group 1 family protein [Aeromicrobium marinum DSM 15272]|uniref:Glycosyltransferase, group 1 family protein n=1 Tax=Aeromicrobium marinum DSM 15272 TaxID=585531 RepID=E2SFA9_9ACTN|nr:glycosyltransferase family 4 protein [Aeromicrobium marinum]EFQ82194.1 glycosyltransferase, group 1 family protein [Aeromicrobium marinum DSM 15272]